MALKEVTLKRVINTSGDTDELFPSTTMDQVRVSTSDTTTLSSHLTSTYIPLSQKGAASGVATLGTDSKVPVSQLPASIIGGLKFQGSVAAADVNTDDEIALLIKGVVDSYGLTAAVGSYWISNGITNWGAPGGYVTPSTGGDYDYAWSEQIPGEEGTGGDSSFTVESGDWVVIQSITQNGTSNDYDVVFGIVNNTYRDATASAKGIVQLTAATDTSSLSGNDAITEGALNSMKVADGSDLASNTNTNKLAPAAHHHGGLYYTETEIGNFFDGTTSISGYNKTNWDNAYSGEITALTFSSSTITLTRGNGSEGALTASLDGQSIDIGTGTLTTDRLSFHNDLDGTNESPMNSLVEYNNEVAVQAYAGPSDINYYPVVNTNNIVTKATAADFEKIFYLASTDTNSDTTVGSIVIQED